MARLAYALTATLLFLTGCAGRSEHIASTTLIVNAWIIDGTGAPARNGAVRIRADRIVEIGDLAPKRGEHAIDAKGQVLAPGFIDTHSHHDAGLFEQRAALPLLSQGVTTIVVGQDGFSRQPLARFFADLEATPVAVNVASYAGHNSIRAKVLGDDFRRVATPAETEAMAAILSEEMAAGALGLSTGLDYDPGLYSSTEEVVALACAGAALNGRYISHIRSEDQKVWEALDEIVAIGRVTRMPVHVSHMKLAMVDWWGQADRYLAVLDRARAEGIEVSGDVYPYEYWQSTMTVLFPKRDFTDRQAAEFALKRLAPAETLRLARFSPEPSLIGKSIAEIARQRGIDPAVTLLDLIHESRAPGAEESVIGTSMSSADVTRFIAWPHSSIGSDGRMGGRHPRGAGAFARFFRLHVGKAWDIALEGAVHKVTGLAARQMGFADRGIIRPGAYADLVLFAPGQIADRATIDNPTALSVGVARLWVNGVLAFENGQATQAFSGMPIRHKASSVFEPCSKAGREPAMFSRRLL